jgi:hypothetical protein
MAGNLFLQRKQMMRRDQNHLLRLFSAAACEAGALDSELIAAGGRLGEADVREPLSRLATWPISV